MAGLGNIVGRHWPDSDYLPSGVQKAEHSGFLFPRVVINAVVAVWAAPAVSASDFTQTRTPISRSGMGQTLAYQM